MDASAKGNGTGSCRQVAAGFGKHASGRIGGSRGAGAVGRLDTGPRECRSRVSFGVRRRGGPAASPSSPRFLSRFARATAAIALTALVMSGATLGLVTPVHAASDGDLRIEDGPSDNEGRLEIFHDGEWGAVCDDFFSTPDANVACKQIGYTGGRSIQRKWPAPGDMSIWLDDVGCTGSESRLDMCPHPGWGQHNCAAREAVGVRCSGTRQILEPPPAPQNVAAQSVEEHGQVTLTWTAPEYDGVIAGYQVRYGVPDLQLDYEWEEWVRVPNGATASSYTFTGLSSFKLYGFQVRAMATTTPGTKSEPVAGVTGGPRVSLTVPGDNQNGVHGNFVKEGKSVTIDAVLTSQPSVSVSVSVESGDSGAVAVSPASLTFTPSNWDVAQPVTVTGVQDSDSDNEYHVSLTLTEDSGADEPQVGNGNANITVYDDDPSSPLHVKARPGDEHVTLSWTAPHVPYGNDEITGYEYRKCRGSAADCSNDGLFGQWQFAGSSTSYQLMSLDNGQAYSFQVRAVAGQYKGLASPMVTATPGFNSSVGLTVGWVPPDLLAAPAAVQERFWTGFTITGRPFPPLNGITAGRKLNFAATTLWTSGVRSVKLELIGPKSASRTDNTAPFTLFENFVGEVMPAGEYTLRATSYSGVDAGGTAGTPKSVTFTLAADNDKPTVRILCAESGSVVSPSSGKRLSVQVLFSELVSGFGLDDVEVTNVEESSGIMSASPTVLPTPYSVDFTIPADATGAIQVTVPADAAEDQAGNGNTASEPLNLAQNRLVTVADADGGEGSMMEFEVTLNAANDCETVTVEYATADGTATAGVDYAATSGTLTFGPGETTKTVSVAVTVDETSESNETFTLQLSNAAAARLADAQATGTITEVSEQQVVALPLSATGLETPSQAQRTVDLAWTLSAQPEGVTVNGVEVQQQAADQSWVTVATLAADATSHTVTGLTAGTSYSFRVRLATSSGNADSDAVSTSTLAAPNPASGLAASNPTQTTVDLAWTLPTQPSGVSVTGVEVQQQGADDAWSAVTTVASDATSHTVTGLTAGTAYTFRIRLVTSSGNVDSDAVSRNTLEAPNPATGLAASNPTQTMVDLTWTLPTQSEGVTVTGVEVQQQAADESWSTVATLAADATSHTVTGLTAGTSYTFRIRLTTSNGNADSDPVEAQTAHMQLEARMAGSAASAESRDDPGLSQSRSTSGGLGAARWRSRSSSWTRTATRWRWMRSRPRTSRWRTGAPARRWRTRTAWAGRCRCGRRRTSGASCACACRRRSAGARTSRCSTTRAPACACRRRAGSSRTCGSTTFPSPRASTAPGRATRARPWMRTRWSMPRRSTPTRR